MDNSICITITYNGNEIEFFTIKSNDLFYAQGYGGYGLQCNYEGDSDEYKIIREKCTEVIKHINELRRFNNVSDKR